ncbi:MAG: hypothetical protein NVSMB27_46500 [Ktedonobacteraceae bacterium]
MLADRVSRSSGSDGTRILSNGLRQAFFGLCAVIIAYYSGTLCKGYHLAYGTAE